jgi:hypothetical protein
MPKVYAFDVDETIEGLAGPVTLSSLLALRSEGHIIGLCGNWGAFVSAVERWHDFVSFMNVGVEKAEFLAHLARHVKAEEYVMVGNILGVSGSSDDQGAAERAGWRFIQERDFADGVR